jgi:hypothetical protein
MQRSAVIIAATCAFMLLMGPIFSAGADEQMEPLTESGDWMAAQHTASMTSAPDVCIAATTAVSGGSGSTVAFALRWSQDDIEIRYEDSGWSLPANEIGQITIEVGSYQNSMPAITYNNDTVAAILTRDQLEALISAMNKASSMSVIVGKDSPTQVSLNGSNNATTAFLTCAGITAPGEGGGGNPF